MEDQCATEIRLSLALARADAERIDADRCAELLDDPAFSWDVFVTTASRHRTLPLIARNMRRLGLDGVDHYVYANFDTAIASYFHHRSRNSLLSAEFGVIAAALRERVERVVVRKGMYLANCVYRDIGVRPMMDMDFLVRPQDIDATVRTMTELGYAMGRPTANGRQIVPMSRADQVYWRLHTDNLPPLRRPTSDEAVRMFVVDVATGIFSAATTGADLTADIVDRAVDVDIAGARVAVAAPEDFVIDLCCHTYKESTTLRYIHRRKHQRLIQYCDLREALAFFGPTLRWARLMDRGRAYGVLPALYFGLSHLEKLFPGTVPVDVSAELDRAADRRFLDEFGAAELDSPLYWTQPFLERMFARDPDSDVPASKSLI